jgi:type VI secretion system protein VasD
MKPDTFFKLVTIVVISAILAACQSMNSTVGGYLNLDTDLQIDFKVDADINPDETGKPSPLFIRLYELKADKMINKAGFIDLYERDKEMLGADMVAVYKLKRFKPGESRTEHFVLDSQTRYVALFAEFLKYRESKYKLIIPVTANNVFANSVVVRVSGDELVFDQKATGESAEH